MNKNSYYPRIEICSESGEVLYFKKFLTVHSANVEIEKLLTIKHPDLYEGFTMNLTGYYTGGNVGYVHLVEPNKLTGEEKRVLTYYRNA